MLEASGISCVRWLVDRYMVGAMALPRPCNPIPSYDNIPPVFFSSVIIAIIWKNQERVSFMGRLLIWSLYRILGKDKGRIVIGGIVSGFGVLMLFGVIGNSVSGSASATSNLLGFGFCLLVIAAGVFSLVKGMQGLKQSAASQQVSYGGAGQYGTPYAPGQSSYPPPAAPYGQPQYGAPYQTPQPTPYGQPAYPPSSYGQAQYVPNATPASPYGQPAAPQYPPAAPYGQPAAPQYPPQQQYAPPAGQYPPYPRQ
jgi:hypothetical protein